MKCGKMKENEGQKKRRGENEGQKRAFQIKCKAKKQSFHKRLSDSRRRLRRSAAMSTGRRCLWAVAAAAAACEVAGATCGCRSATPACGGDVASLPLCVGERRPLRANGQVAAAAAAAAPGAQGTAARPPVHRERLRLRGGFAPVSHRKPDSSAESLLELYRVCIDGPAATAPAFAGAANCLSGWARAAAVTLMVAEVLGILILPMLQRAFSRGVHNRIGLPPPVGHDDCGATLTTEQSGEDDTIDGPSTVPAQNVPQDAADTNNFQLEGAPPQELGQPLAAEEAATAEGVVDPAGERPDGVEHDTRQDALIAELRSLSVDADAAAVAADAVHAPDAAAHGLSPDTTSGAYVCVYVCVHRRGS